MQAAWQAWKKVAGVYFTFICGLLWDKRRNGTGVEIRFSVVPSPDSLKCVLVLVLFIRVPGCLSVSEGQMNYAQVKSALLTHTSFFLLMFVLYTQTSSVQTYPHYNGALGSLSFIDSKRHTVRYKQSRFPLRQTFIRIQSIIFYSI